MYKNVVIGINGLAGDPDAVALAQALAPNAGRFALAHVRVIEGVATRGSVSAFDAAEREMSRELLERERASLAPDAEVASIAATSVGGGLHDVAVRRDADLIVVGSSHRSAVGRVLAGDDARSVLHHAACAVAIAPHDYANGARRTATIGVAYDGSDASEVAMAHAGGLAEALHAKLVAGNVVEMHIRGCGPGISVLVEDPDTIAADARERLGDLGPAKLDVVVGPVREELAALSQRVDVLVCGSRRLSAVKRVVLGSTSDYLARYAACPLLVTPASDEPRIAAWQALRHTAAVR